MLTFVGEGCAEPRGRAVPTGARLRAGASRWTFLVGAILLLLTLLLLLALLTLLVLLALLVAALLAILLPFVHHIINLRAGML